MIDFRTFPLLFGFLILINASFGIIATGLQITILSPYGSNITQVSQPNFYNGSGNALTLTANMTNPAQTGINNQSATLTFDWFVDYIDVALASLQYAWLMISGGFINSFFNVIGYPSYFINGIYFGVLGISIFYWVQYKVTGKE